MTTVWSWIKRRIVWLLIAAIVLVLVLALVFKDRRPEVMVAEATSGALVLRIAASGIVEAQSADLSFEGSGRIAAIEVAEGDAVSDTQVLAWLDPLPSASTTDIFGTPITPTYSGTDAIRAPYAGTVVEVYLREGAVTGPGQPVLRIVAAGDAWVTAFIDSEDAAHLRVGDRLRCRAGGYLSQAWEVIVQAIGKEAVSRRELIGSSRQVRVRCEPARSPFPLAPGTEVDVDGEAPLVEDAVLIPTSAVVRDGIHDRVWVVEGELVSLRDVELGPNNFDQIDIRTGLRPGETVVAYGKDGLEEGQSVQTKPVPNGSATHE